jgi:hypothetical protein
MKSKIRPYGPAVLAGLLRLPVEVAGAVEQLDRGLLRHGGELDGLGRAV